MDKKDIYNQLHLADALIEAGRLNDGYAIYDELLQLDLLDFSAILRYGNNLLNQGDQNKALSFYNSTLRQIQNSTQKAELYYRMGCLHQEANNVHKALRNFEQATELDPTNRIYYGQLKKVLQQHSPDVTKSGSSHNQIQRAKNYIRLGNLLTASKIIDNVLTNDPGNDGAQYLKSKVAILLTKSKQNSATKDSQPASTENRVSSKSNSDIEEFVGQKHILSEIESFGDIVRVNDIRKTRGLATTDISLHSVFTGSPGTGKTTMARYLAKKLKDLEILKEGHVVEIDRSGLVAEYTGQTAVRTNRAVDSALGGVLFIDEAYSLARGGNDGFGIEAIDTLLKRMEDQRNEFMVIMAGYTQEMKLLIESNSGLRSRFNHWFDFKDYTSVELMHIFNKMLKKGGYSLRGKLAEKIQGFFKKQISIKGSESGNGRLVRNTYESIIRIQASRIAQLTNPSKEELEEIKAEDLEFIASSTKVDHKGLQKAQDELDRLIGLNDVKSEFSKFIHERTLMIERGRQNMKVFRSSNHFVFSGPPGTGKTTVARVFGKFLKAIGQLSKGHLVEVDRSTLVGRYLGESEKNTTAMIDKALGGILFIDEAYALNSSGKDSDIYGKAVVNTLLKKMEDNREDLVVIVAGYEQEMRDFINSNPGLKSRFTQFLKFSSYSSKELMEILSRLISVNQFKWSESAKSSIKEFLGGLTPDIRDQLGNARLVRNIFERLVRNMSSEVNQDEESKNLEMISNVDAQAVIKQLNNQIRSV